MSRKNTSKQGTKPNSDNTINGVNYWVLDIETEGWDTLALFILTDGKTVYDGWYDKQALSEAYAKIPAGDCILSHNGGRFDFLCLLDCHDASWEARLANGIISMQPKNGARCVDSYRLFVLSLDKWTGKKTKLPFPCICGKDCGAYCQIKRDMSEEYKKIVYDYCMNDCLILLKKYKEDILQLKAEGFEVFNKDGKIKNTIGSVAYATAKKLCDLPDGLIDHTTYNTTKQAYFGGRCECIIPKARRLVKSDIYSAYPWALTQPVPIGQYKSLGAKDADRAFIERTPGLYYIKGYQAPSKLALLPTRLKNNRVVWATGEIKGLYALPEVELFQAYAEKFEIEGAMVWEEEKAIYKPYIDTCFKLRKKYKDAESDFEFVMKIFLNSLSGKLAQGKEHSRIQKFDVNNGYFPYGPNWAPIGDSDYWCYTADDLISESAKPWQAAYLTSRVRVKLFERLYRNIDSVAYFDTDSTFLALQEQDKEGIGKNLGDFVDEGFIYDWLGYAPKVYRFMEYKNNELVYNHKAKGVPGLTKENKSSKSMFDGYIRGEVIKEERGVNGIKSSLKRFATTFVRKELTRSSKSDSRLMGNRLIVGNSSEPLHLENGVYRWPSSDLNPYEILKYLKDKK